MVVSLPSATAVTTSTSFESITPSRFASARGYSSAVAPWAMRSPIMSASSASKYLSPLMLPNTFSSAPSREEGE